MPDAAELTVQQRLLLRGSRILIPASLRINMLDCLHASHQGLVKCTERARQSVWPGLSKQLETLVQTCRECCKHRVQKAEPLQCTTQPILPWLKAATDLGRENIPSHREDYFSRYIETSKFSGETSNKVVRHRKFIFA